MQYLLWQEGKEQDFGHIGPKGTYCLHTAKGPKYIFEIIVDTLKQAKEEYGVTLWWYIMTSKENHEETVTFLNKHEYFGYDKNKVIFFTQGELPLIDTNGKLIIGKDKQIKEAADGNGGIYEAIAKAGLIEQMKKQQIEWIFISNVDNILSHFVDPLLLGLTIQQEKKIGAKSVAKTNPKEKVGVFCKMNGKPKIIEYIDLPAEMAEERDEQGELLYGEVNIANYLFHLQVLENLAEVKLPFHAAFKKSGYLTKTGEYKEAQEPNVYKFEAFIFDAFARVKDIAILRVDRKEEFAPVKNKEGTDSPQTAVELYNAKFKIK
ncbi:MAG: UDPGP type 1 family protein [Clostridia bacterium]|jgi:UDP-N-acetylglucosamine/UDP-N-acetylgalactosamine diphosphorylase|nr:UDPGP type 1 family protein [Clostridia bacterium]